MNTYILVLFFIGIIITVIGYYESKEMPAPKTIIKFIDKTIEEAQKSGQDDVYSTYITMFSDPPILI